MALASRSSHDAYMRCTCTSCLHWDFDSSHYAIQDLLLSSGAVFLLKLTGSWLKVRIEFLPQVYEDFNLKRAWWICGSYKNHPFRFNAAELAAAYFPVRLPNDD